MSYVSQQFLLCDNSSTANFKNWAQAISAAFGSAGWTQTADTGQVNWSTVTVPVAGSFVYEVWQPADALQTGSTAYYVRIEYGTSSGSPAGPRLRINIGAATDGAGNLTGLTMTRQEAIATNSTGQGSLLTYDCYFCGDTDRFNIMMWRGLGVGSGSGGGSLAVMYSIERTRQTDGTNISDGVSLIPLGSNAPGVAQTQQIINFGIGVASFATRTYGFMTDGNNASGAFNNSIPVCPTFPIYGKIGNALTGVGWVHTQDVAEGCIFTTTLYGATRTYIACGNFATLPSTTVKACMRYD